MGGHLKKLDKMKSHEKGCVSKHQGAFSEGDSCSYRWNGYEEMKSGSFDGKKKIDLYQIDFTIEENYKRLPYVYHELKIGHGKDNPSNWRYANDPTDDKEAWWFKGENFKTAYLPYNHNYHHILPWDSLKDKLNLKELDILQTAGYKLNDKLNMIILPTLYQYGIALKLPDHPYGHKKYNRAIANIIRDIKEEIKDNEAENDCELDEETAPDFVNSIINWQKEQFKVIVAYGEELSANDPEAEPNPNRINDCPMAKTAVAAGGS